MPLNRDVAGVAAGLRLALLLRDEEGVHRVLGIGRHEDEHLVAGLQCRVAPRDDETVGPDHGNDDRIAWEVQVGDGGVVDRRILRQGAAGSTPRRPRPSCR